MLYVIVVVNRKKKSCDTLGTSGVRRKRNSNSRAIGYQFDELHNHPLEKIIFESVYGNPDYKVFQFDELHNHPLEKRSDLKKVRQMSYSEKEFSVRASTSKIGPTMAHKLRASLRDDVLDCMFWADEMEKAYYAEFGDVISFDATFRTNKYRMVFVLFTAIDHHKKSVTVGSGLLSNENIESYSWLLKAFLETHGKEPTLVLTDQDAAIKQAIENVFRNSKHRLCMWHIMKKLEKKISDHLFTNTDFRKRFLKLVWDINMKPDVFEVKWGLLMKEFNLENTRWFKDVFTIRDSWITGYLSDISMCGLMKTTSRSESDCENVKLVNDSYYSFESCLDIVRDDKKRLALFAERQKMLLEEFDGDYISPGLKSKTYGEVVCKLLGVSIPIPEEINIHVPEVQSNKGSGIKKRILYAGEVAYENSKKEHRMCSRCGKRVPHNLRTCSEKFGAAKSAKYS
ncbi:unnamed protein product [Lactuca saligna]|uniref:MULE transposase domain-containing protein n=1 Tax=Lactuca saligna TaxID=75948 RepID=A0AA35YQR5_LACSI|nr:unnamed protein product [Lactuca saligna]